MSIELDKLTIASAAAGLRAKEFSSVELTQAHLDRITATEDQLHSFITLTADGALAAAKQADDALAQGTDPGVLAGIPFGAKDLFCTRGVRTTAASKILDTYVSPHTATSVQKVFDQRGVMVGKLNLDEFACGSSTETSYVGPSKNPWDVSRVPGGSSGGSAAAVAASQCVYAFGTDTGGSIRQPASLCGIVGLKPTYGRVSRYGVISMASSLDQVGPMTKTVEDAAIVLQAIAGADVMDGTAAPIAVPDYRAELTKSIAGLRIGVPKEYFGEGLDPAVEQAVRTAIARYEELGATIQPISLPHTMYALAVYYVLMPSELSSNLSRYDGVRFGQPAAATNLIEQYEQTRGQGFGAEIRRRVMLGTYALSAGYYDAYYKQAQKVRTLVKRDFDQAFEHVDCILTPTSPTVAFRFGEKTDNPLTMYLSDAYTISTNIAGIPGLSLPCGFAQPAGGGPELPIGLQLLGKQFDEATILRAGHHYEQATDWHTRHPALG